MTTFYPTDEDLGAVLDLTSPGLSSELDRAGRAASGAHRAPGRPVPFGPHKPGHPVLAGDRNSALVELQQEPFGYSNREAEAILDMPMSWQTGEHADHLRQERDHLIERRASLRQHVAEVLALHWFG